MGEGVGYRYEAATVEGFVQQLAVSYFRNQYWFYVQGEIPEGKCPRATDEKLLLKYGIARSKWAKYRDQGRGEAKLQYLRYRTTFLLLKTDCPHPLFDGEEAGSIRDAREIPVQFYGYSVSYKDGHPHVRIATPQYRVLVEDFLNAALTAQADLLAARFRALPFEPFGPVKLQLRRLLIRVNELRRAAGLQRVDRECLRTKRKPLRPFVEPAAAAVMTRAPRGWEEIEA
ncbi:MAG: hypothetical protein U0797_00905 [Gemmataceae bacterium]